jgi:Ca-activated chloride channel family protein
MSRVAEVKYMIAGLPILAALVYCLQAGSFALLRPDREGFGFYRREAYGEAAQAFADPQWKGVALYRDGSFEEAAGIFSGMDTAQGAYNHGNALLMQGRYEEAVRRFDRAIELQPGWEDASLNREIAQARAALLVREGGEMTGGKLEADEIVFTEGTSSPSAGEEVVEEAMPMSDSELQALWLRQVQTKPADFLRAKFSFIGVPALICLAADDVIVRTRVLPEEALVGQRVILRVEVLGKDGWANLSRMDNFEAPGALIFQVQTQGSRIQDTVAGSSYTGQRYELFLYPQRAGEIRIAPVAAEVSVRSWGLNAGETMHPVELPEFTLSARYPPGMENLPGLVTTTSLGARQTWEPEQTSVRVGDAIQRHVEFSARDVPGMAFPPLAHADIPTVAIYPGEPETTDQTDRGALSGKRRESVTYIFEQSGTVALPSVIVNWWDLSDNSLKQIELPGRIFEVEPNPAAAGLAIQPGTGEKPPGKVFRSVLVVLAGLLVIGALGRKYTIKAWRKWQERRLQSERHHFQRVLEACKSADPARVMRVTMQWLDRLEEGNGTGRLDIFLQQHGDAESWQVGLRLAAMDGSLQPADLMRFHRGLLAARRNWLWSRRQASRLRKAVEILPEFNKMH